MCQLIRQTTNYNIEKGNPEGRARIYKQKYCPGYHNRPEHVSRQFPTLRRNTQVTAGRSISASYICMNEVYYVYIYHILSSLTVDYSFTKAPPSTRRGRPAV